jgi:thiamine-phosphate pyrophosphorylase
MRNDLHRIIDANINRASEALRVIEEWARFSKDSTRVSEKLKRIRHFINTSFLENSNLILSRESNLDIGKEIENTSKKQTIRNIIRANCKRAEEALRVLSEYGQLLNVNESDIKSLEVSRYEIYTLEKELIIAEKTTRIEKSELYFVATPGKDQKDSDFLSIIEKSIEGGVDIIQLRVKDKSEKEIINLGKEIKKLTTNTETLFIVNDRIDLALLCEADGVHLGQDDLSISEARKITPDGFIIGLSTHSPEQGNIGQNSGADYLGVGPVFATPTKPDYIPAGLEYVKYANKNITLPWFAIGGIDESNIDKVINAGAKRVAVVRAILNAKDVKQVVKTLKGRFICEQVR